MSTDRLIRSIQGVVVPYQFDLCVKDMGEIHSAAKDDVELMGWCFRFGFLQGQRAAKAEARRREKQLDERDTSGWYRYLRRWLDRNIGNTRLLELLGIRARYMENDGIRVKTREVTPHD